MNKITSRVLNKIASLKRNELFSKSVSNLFLQVFGMFLSYVGVFLISHIYNADILGYYTLSTVVLLIASMVVLFGINTATVQMVPGLNADKNNDAVSSVLLKGLIHTLAVGFIVSVVVYFSANIIATYIIHKPKLAAAYQVISFAIIPLSLLTLISDFLRAFGKNILWALIRGVFISAVFIILFVIMYYVSKNPDPVLLYTIANIIAFLITLIPFFIFIKKRRISLKPEKLKFKPSYNDIKKLSFPMFLFGSSNLIGGWISILMVGAYCSNADTGIFRVIDRISSLCTLTLMGINAVLAPKIAAAYAKGDFTTLKNIVVYGTKLSFWLSLPIQMTLILFRKQSLELFGHQFLIGSQALVIILIGYIFNSLAGPVGQVLNMTHHQVYLRNVSFIGLIITVLLNYILIPIWGISGAAVASMSNAIFINFVCVVKINKEFSFTTLYNPLEILRKK